jgi:hypothetical protein
MSEGSSTTEGMKGGGYYDDHSEYQRATAAGSSRFISDAIAAIALPDEASTFVLADYGSSTGRNSVASVRAALQAVRSRRATQPIAVIHNDLVTNDWNDLFANVASADGYLTTDGPAPLPLASAVSFFEPAAPSASVQFGMSFSAAHWLRTQPSVTVPEGFYFCEATGAARSALQVQAAEDWVTFLRARAADLVPGGRLLVQTVGTDTSGAISLVTAQKLMRAMRDVAGDLAARGSLTAEAVDRYLLPVYARTVDEARAPADGETAPLRDVFDVIVCRTDPVANPYYDQWRQDADADAYARSYCAFVRAFTESSLRENLFEPGASQGQTEAVLDEYFQRLTERFAADPERDRFEDWTLTVVLARR